jgi:hypothetical protein
MVGIEQAELWPWEVNMLTDAIGEGLRFFFINLSSTRFSIHSLSSSYHPHPNSKHTQYQRNLST